MGLQFSPETGFVPFHNRALLNIDSLLKTNIIYKMHTCHPLFTLREKYLTDIKYCDICVALFAACVFSIMVRRFMFTIN